MDSNFSSYQSYFSDDSRMTTNDDDDSSYEEVVGRKFSDECYVEKKKIVVALVFLWLICILVLIFVCVITFFGIFSYQDRKKKLMRYNHVRLHKDPNKLILLESEMVEIDPSTNPSDYSFRINDEVFYLSSDEEVEVTCEVGCSCFLELEEDYENINNRRDVPPIPQDVLLGKRYRVILKISTVIVGLGILAALIHGTATGFFKWKFKDKCKEECEKNGMKSDGEDDEIYDCTIDSRDQDLFSKIVQREEDDKNTFSSESDEEVNEYDATNDDEEDEDNTITSYDDEEEQE